VKDPWPSMQNLLRAVHDPGFAVCRHMGGRQGTPQEKDAADRDSAPWVVHTHIPWNITEALLAEKMTNLGAATYLGCQTSKIMAVGTKNLKSAFRSRSSDLSCRSGEAEGRRRPHTRANGRDRQRARNRLSGTFPDRSTPAHAKFRRLP
jgi:hypothetical protein